MNIHMGIHPVRKSLINGADSETRTPDLLITNENNCFPVSHGQATQDQGPDCYKFRVRWWQKDGTFAPSAVRFATPVHGPAVFTGREQSAGVNAHDSTAEYGPGDRLSSKAGAGL